MTTQGARRAGRHRAATAGRPGLRAEADAAHPRRSHRRCEDPRPSRRPWFFVGRVIANPNRSGLVQSITGGRVIAPERGLPRLGQAVAKGDVLASVEPPMPIADRTTISERMGEIEQLIAVAEAKLKRLRAARGARRGAAIPRRRDGSRARRPAPPARGRPRDADRARSPARARSTA